MMVARVTGLEAHEFIHTFGDVHLYKNHHTQAVEQLLRDPRPLPEMIISPKVQNTGNSKSKYSIFKHIFNFGERLVSAMDKLGDAAVVAEEVIIDAEIKLEEVDQLLIKQLTKLSPFGAGNAKPIFAFRNVTPQAVELFGKTKEHTKLIFQTEQGKVEAIAFFQTPEQFTKTPKPDVPRTMIGHVEQSFFMGRMQLRIRIIDIV